MNQSNTIPCHTIPQSPRAEAYTKEEHRQMVAEYFAAPSVEAIEARPPWYVPNEGSGSSKY